MIGVKSADKDLSDSPFDDSNSFFLVWISEITDRIGSPYRPGELRLTYVVGPRSDTRDHYEWVLDDPPQDFAMKHIQSGRIIHEGGVPERGFVNHGNRRDASLR